MIGKIIAIVMTVLVVGFFITLLVMIQFNPSREYNQNLSKELKKPLSVLYDLQIYFEKARMRQETLDPKIMSSIAGEFEYFYFPNNINDSRLPLIAVRTEGRGHFKSIKGELSKEAIGVGFFVMYGDTFVIKTLMPKQMVDFLKLDDDKIELDKSYLESGEAILIGGK